MFRRIAALAASLSLVACASTYKPVVYDSSVESVRTIAMSNDMAYDRPFANGGAGVSAAFGGIGALAAVAIAEERASGLEEVLAKTDFDVESVLQEALSAELAKGGYEVSFQNLGPRPSSAMMAKSAKIPYKTFSGGPEGTDAYLDMIVTWGYSSAGTELWVPLVTVDMNMVSADGSKVLAKDAIVYANSHYFKGVTLVPVDETKGFKSLEELAKQPDEAATLIEEAIRETVAVAVAKLK